MSCEQFQDLLTAFLENELSADENLLISTHLEQCPECRELLKHMQEMQLVFADLPEVEPPARIRKNVMAVIAQTQPAKKPVHNWQWRRVAAALVIFCLSFATGLYPILEMQFAADASILEQDSSDLVKDAQKFSVRLQSGENVTTGESTVPEAGIIMNSAPDGNTLLPPRDAQGGEGAEKVIVDENTMFITGNTDDTLQITTTAEETVEEEQSLLFGVSRERLLFAFTGMFLSLVMLYYARPKKV